MIKIFGHLAIRTIQARNGELNVSRISIGELAITEICASSHSTGGRLVIEISAPGLHGDCMALDGLDTLTAYDSAQSPDLRDEEQPVAKP